MKKRKCSNEGFLVRALYSLGTSFSLTKRIPERYRDFESVPFGKTDRQAFQADQNAIGQDFRSVIGINKQEK